MNFQLRLFKNVFKQLEIILKLTEAFDLNQYQAVIYLFSVTPLPKYPSIYALAELDDDDKKIMKN